MSLQAYRNAQIKTQDPRQLEYLLFVEITRELIAARDADDAIALTRGLHRNIQLWAALRNDCADEANQMPKDTRAGIISLSIWVEKHTREVRRNQQPVDALINVNKSIMQGLKAQSNNAAA